MARTGPADDEPTPIDAASLTGVLATLAVPIVTAAGGALFGAAGLILAAPVTSALTRISVDLRRARAEAAPARAAIATPTPEPT